MESTSKRFRDRNVIVTGAGAGIGRGIAERFAAEGAKVALLEICEQAGKETADAIRQSGGCSEFFPADVSDESQVRASVEASAQRFGGIDHVVNNAGIVLVKSVEESTSDDWDHVMGVNCKSIGLVTKYALPYLRKSDSPTIVNLGSVSGHVAQQGTPIYVASKGAVLMLTKALALDLAPQIRVNCVCPGITDTPMLWEHLNSSRDPEQTARTRLSRVPLGEMIQPRQIGDAVLFLSSSESAGITGSSLVVDAGYTSAAEWAAP